MSIRKFAYAAILVVASAFILGSCSKDDEDDNEIDNYEYVDLGLPSGTLWATCNVGASKPEEYGNYYAWGETTSKSVYDWNSYKWCDNGSEYKISKYCTYEMYGSVDNKSELETEDDVANVGWGRKWRMPSWEQIKELINASNTTVVWTTKNGISGRLITSKKNGNSIFLPAAGYRGGDGDNFTGEGLYGFYWYRSLSSSDSNNALILLFGSNPSLELLGIPRCYGASVRPVRLEK